MYILKGLFYFFICLLAVSSASAYITDEGESATVYIIQKYTDSDIIYCNNTDCYLVSSTDAFETRVNTCGTEETLCTTVSPFEFTRPCKEDSTLCSLFVSDSWEDWFYFGFENLGKEPKFAKTAFILAHTSYLDSGADTDPTTERLLASLLDIDLSTSGANRLHAFILSLYLANRNISEDTTFTDLKKIFLASIKSAPRILLDIFDETITYVETLYQKIPANLSAEVTNLSAEVATFVRSIIWDIFPNATTAETLIPKSLAMTPASHDT